MKSRRTRFLTVALDEIKHLTLQAEEAESGGADARVKSNLPKTIGYPSHELRTVCKSGHVSKYANRNFIWSPHGAKT